MKSDTELLRSYAASGDEEAFASLVTRHGGAVYRACLRQLGDAHEAEDAAQAVFMALSRKARSLGNGGDLAAWLHGVARRATLYAVRSRVNRAKRHEEAAMVRAVGGEAEQEAPENEARNREALVLLDRELAALPAPQRQAVVLRHLEGRSPEEAAEVAGVLPDTLVKRANRALARLRARLSRRGVALSAAALGALLASEAQAAVSGMPAGLLPSIVAASKTAASGAAGGAAGMLMEGVLKTMFWTKVKTAAATAIAAALLGTGAPLAYRTLAGDASAARPSAKGSAGTVADAPEPPPAPVPPAPQPVADAASGTLHDRLAQVVDVDLRDVDLDTVLAWVSKQGGFEIKRDPDLRWSRFTRVARGVKLRNVLDSLPFLWEKDGDHVWLRFSDDPLDDVKVSFTFIQTPLSEVLGQLSRDSGVKITYRPEDVAVRTSRDWVAIDGNGRKLYMTKDEGLITLKVMNASVKLALDWITRLGNLDCFVNAPSSSQREIFVGHVPPPGLVYERIYKIGPYTDDDDMGIDCGPRAWEIFGSQDYKRLAEEAPELVLPETWGGTRSVRATSRGLVVYQDERGHQAVLSYLIPIFADAANKARQQTIDNTRALLEPRLNAMIDVDWANLPLTDALDDLRRKAGDSFSTIVDNWSLAPRKDAQMKTPVTLVQKRIAIGDALDTILGQAGLQRMYLRGAVFISTEDGIRRQSPESAARDCERFLRPIYGLATDDKPAAPPPKPVQEQF